MDEQSGTAPENEPRVHPQDPSEGADPDRTPSGDEVRAHPQDPAEGADDSSTDPEA